MIEPTKSADKVITEIASRVRQVWAEKDNPEKLSQLGTELAALNWGLGEWLSEFTANEIEAKTEYELEVATETDSLTSADYPVNKAELKAKLKYAGDKRAYNQILTTVEKVKIARKDVEKVIDMIRSRLADIRKEIQ